MFCESLETRRFLTVTLRPEIPPGPSGDPGTLPPDCVEVTQDANGKVTIRAIAGSTNTNGGSSGGHNLGQWSKGGSGKWKYNHGGSSSGGSSGNSSGGSSGVADNCELDVAIVEENGTLVITEISTGATWDVTNATAVCVIGTDNGDDIFYQGNSIGANIQAGGGIDSITVADTGTGSTNADAGSGNDSINLLVGNGTGTGTTLHAGSGADTIFINSGVGIYNTGAAEAIVYAEGGNDVITTYDGTNTVYGGGGNDVVLEVGGNNTVYSAQTQS